MESDFVGFFAFAPQLPFIFGVAYAYCAWKNRAPRVFIAIGAAGKLAFFATLVGFCLSGDLPLTTEMLGSGDLVFGCLFLAWLAQSRNSLNTNQQ